MNKAFISEFDHITDVQKIILLGEIKSLDRRVSILFIFPQCSSVISNRGYQRWRGKKQDGRPENVFEIELINSFSSPIKNEIS